MTFAFTPSLARRSLIAAALVVGMAGCATGPVPLDLADTLAKTPSLSTLNSLVVKAGLVNSLTAAGPITVFAPNNDAFKAVPAKTMEALANDPAALKEVLTYHVIPARVMAAQVKNVNVKTANGAEVALSKAGDFVTVENAAVVKADIAATNGVLHIVDAVLMPPKK